MCRRMRKLAGARLTSATAYSYHVRRPQWAVNAEAELRCRCPAAAQPHDAAQNAAQAPAVTPGTAGRHRRAAVGNRLRHASAKFRGRHSHRHGDVHPAAQCDAGPGQIPLRPQWIRRREGKRTHFLFPISGHLSGWGPADLSPTTLAHCPCCRRTSQVARR
jgi:hypothetical protein